MAAPRGAARDDAGAALVTYPACAADNRDGAGRTGDWTIGERPVTRKQGLRLTSAVFFFVDYETAGDSSRVVRSLVPGAGLVVSDVRHVNHRSMLGVDGASP
jgi:hypothetical protein